MKSLIAISLAIFCTGCAGPYSGQIHRLDKAYAAGRIKPEEYNSIRWQLVAADTQWRRAQAAQMQAATQQFAAGLAAGANAYNQSYQNQQWLNAYNARTVMMTYPQTVNVEHSETIYLRQY